MCMSNRMAGVILCSGTVGGGTARPFRQWGTCAEPHYSAGITCSKGDDLIQYVYEPGIQQEGKQCMRKTGARMEDSYGRKKVVERSGSLPDLSAQLYGQQW